MVGSMDAADLGKVTVSIAWDPAATTGDQDLDLAAFALGADDGVPGDDHMVFFNNPTSPDGALHLAVDSNDIDGHFREQLTIALDGISERVRRIVLVVSSYDALLPFAEFTGGFLQVDSTGLGIVATYDLTNVTDGHAFEWGELYRDGETWKLAATGVVHPGLQDVVTAYGV